MSHETLENLSTETRTITYAELLTEVKKAANALTELGVGAPHSVVFGGFSSEALLSRIQDADASLVITADGGFRKAVHLLSSQPSTKHFAGRRM